MIMALRDEVKKPFTYIVFYKPFGVLSQFTGEAGRKTLSEFGPFPKDVYPVGRLDADSEGLLLLTDDNDTKHMLLEPEFGHPRTYLVQVERIPSEDAMKKLQTGVMIEGQITRHADVRLLQQEPEVPPRRTPIRYRKNVPTAWLALTLTEGRNRQVRKMTAAVGHPTLRLMRIAHGSLNLKGLAPGEHRVLSAEEVQVLLSSLRKPARR
jgi:23S rRNA pseudouridine2457 synthase